MLEEDVLRYQQRFIEEHDVSGVYCARTKIKVHNMPDSANRYPQGRIGWINY